MFLIFRSSTPSSDSIIEKQESSIVNDQELDTAIDALPVDTPAPVPQIKIGPDGDIIIDEKSLVSVKIFSEIV